MQKKLKIFDVRPPRPDPEDLGSRIAVRRLARRTHRMESSPEVAEWLSLELAMWHLRQSDDDLTIRERMKPTVFDYPRYPSRLSSAERDWIMAWTRRWVDRRPVGSPLSEKLPAAERDALIAAASNMQAIHLSEHQVDMAFADIHSAYPWLGSLTEKAWLHALLRSREGRPAGVGPLLLLGPPGIGKSSWSRAVARALGVPLLDVDVGATGGVHDLQGSARGWGSAERGRLIASLISGRLANPLVVLDEIDAGSSSVGTTRGSLPGLFKVMMGMIEPSTSRSWICPYYQVKTDLRHVSWISTCNNIRNTEQALLDRMTIVTIPDLTREQLLEFAEREAAVRFDDDVFVELVVRKIGDSLRHGHRLSLRHVTRILDRVQIASEAPLLH